MELFSTCPLCIILSTDQLTAAFNEEKFMPQKLCSWTHGAQIVWFEQNTHHSLISSCHRIFTGWLKLKIETDSSSILAMSTCPLVQPEGWMWCNSNTESCRWEARERVSSRPCLWPTWSPPRSSPSPSLIFPAIVLSEHQLFLLSGHILFQEPLKQICC